MDNTCAKLCFPVLGRLEPDNGVEGLEDLGVELAPPAVAAGVRAHGHQHLIRGRRQPRHGKSRGGFFGEKRHVYPYEDADFL